jgi:hypothetical protein
MSKMSKKKVKRSGKYIYIKGKYIYIVGRKKIDISSQAYAVSLSTK